MRTKPLALIVAFACLLLAGCKKDAEVKTVLTDFDSFTNELVKRVESASDPAAGVDGAQKYFDSKKAEMTTKMDTLKGIRGYQVGEETRKMMESSLVDDAKKIANLQVKYMGTSMRDPTFKAKLDKLTRDYQSLFKM
ncbi:MAG TPA: hypothetical protein VEM96_06000 [Pyrinomonadaceae bacterium]|nr:hypothetical protein [Pyrinomonadaceae bacterium]